MVCRQSPNGYLVFAEYVIVNWRMCSCVLMPIRVDVSAYTHVYISCSAFRACIAVLHFHLYKPLSGIRAKDLRTTHGAAIMILIGVFFEIQDLFVEHASFRHRGNIIARFPLSPSRALPPAPHLQ